MIKMSLSADLARQFITIMGALVDEFRMTISKDRWIMRAVDPANVAIVVIDLPKDNFESWEWNPSDNWTSSIDGHPTGVFQEQIAVGIEVDKIKEFLGELNLHDNLLDEEMYDPVEFTFSLTEKGYQLELKQGMFSRTILLIPESDIRRAPKVPALSGLDYRLRLNTLEFQRIVKKAAKVNDYIRLGFRREEGSVTFIASTADSDDQPWEATKHTHNWQALKDGARDSSSSLFSLDYLCDIAEKIPSDMVWLYLGEDWPCILSFVLGQNGTVEYKIAPRIEDESYGRNN